MVVIFMVAAGDEAVFLESQQEVCFSADEVAARVDAISYEIITRMSPKTTPSLTDDSS